MNEFSFFSKINLENLKKNSKVSTYEAVKYNKDYEFLHEAAITAFHDVLLAAWYNNPKKEFKDETPIRYCMSADKGKTWSEPVTLITDKTQKYLYCPPVFCIYSDTLYMLVSKMDAPDHACEVLTYEYIEKNQSFILQKTQLIPFKLNTNSYKLDNGKLILPGRITEPDFTSCTPAVLISDSGNPMDDWRSVKMQPDKMLPDGTALTCPEISLIINHGHIYAFTRNDEKDIPLVYVSDDYGETWLEPRYLNFPFVASKTYSGTLSDGRNYIIGNIADKKRSTLAIFFSKKESMDFEDGFILQDGLCQELGYGSAWHYPSAIEDNGKLYVLYTSNIGDDWYKRSGVISVIEL